MKFLADKKNGKKITIILLIIMLFNLACPKISNAGWDEFGGKLFKPIAQLLRGVGDLTMKGLQLLFIGDGSIEKTNLSDEDVTDGLSKVYCIRYSPGLIFSNRVGLDVNFINPADDIKINNSDTEANVDRREIAAGTTIDYIATSSEATVLADLGYKEEMSDTGVQAIEEIFNDDFWDYVNEWREFTVNGTKYKIWSIENSPTIWCYEDGVEDPIFVKQMEPTNNRMDFKDECKDAIIALLTEAKDSTEYNDKKTAYIEEIKKQGENLQKEVDSKFQSIYSVVFTFENSTLELQYNRDGNMPYVLNYYKINKTTNEEELVIEQASKTLQPMIATWYKALRAIALVGLLSILVYVGIRILISSTGQEKAKYKKMIIDWLAALCLLFVIQYIMLFTLEIVNKITEVLSVSVVGIDGQDELMSNVRNELGEGDDFSEIFSELLIYLVLVIHTVIFTIQYLKRLLYMAFFTMIAPLVSLTYPLDKIKDGKAQAFSIWLREYIFNALLQPMHLLLYVIFVSSASSLVEENWIYAIVAIGFLVPAEKFFRKMFGFEQASSASPIGAAAGGALIMNAINKMGQKAGKHAAGGKGSGNSGGGSGNGGSAPRYVASPNGGAGGGSGSSSGGGSGSGNGGTGSGSGGGTGGSNGGTQQWGQTVNPAGAAGGRSFINGAKTLAGRYNPLNRGNRAKLLKGTGRLVRKGIVGAAGAATLGTVGLAAGIATGDAGKALSYGAAGAGVGFAGANALGDKAAEFEKKNREIFKEGALGTEEYNTRGSIQELTRDNDFNSICKQLGVRDQAGREALIREYHSNGITNSAEIKKAMNIRARTGASQNEIIAAQKIMQQAQKDGMKRKDIEASLKGRGVTGASLDKAMSIIDML